MGGIGSAPRPRRMEALARSARATAAGVEGRWAGAAASVVPSPRRLVTAAGQRPAGPGETIAVTGEARPVIPPAADADATGGFVGAAVRPRGGLVGDDFDCRRRTARRLSSKRLAWLCPARVSVRRRKAKARNIEVETGIE